MEKATTKPEMTDYEFYNLQRRAQAVPWSPFAEFMWALVGYDLYVGDVHHSKSEVYEMGLINPKRIIAGETKVTAINREDNAVRARNKKAWVKS